MNTPLRLMIYDRTCTGRPIGLTHTWIVGGLLYGGLGRLDAWSGAATWTEALAWLGRFQGDRTIGEIQYWGHGNWGHARIADERLDVSALGDRHPLRPALDQIRERLAPEAQWWFRTCDTFASTRGQTFARRWTDFFGRPAAGFTHIIGPWQSGLHRLAPGNEPHWSPSEGIALGTPDDPKKSTWSGLGRPNTISCLSGTVPRGW